MFKKLISYLLLAPLLLGQVDAATKIDLATQVKGNLPPTNLNNGTNASLNTFLNGLGQWSAPTKANVGLGNVDNTSDANKPVSGPQATAITTSITNHVNAANPHPQYAKELPTNTIDTSWRNIVGNTSWPISKQGGSAQALSRWYQPVMADIPANTKIVIGFSTTSSYLENTNLNGATWQVGVEPAPGWSAALIPAYSIPFAQQVQGSTPYADVPSTGSLTRTFDTTKGFAQFVFTTDRAYKKGSFISGWVWAKNGFGVSASNDIGDKNRIPASQYVGEFFAYDINGTNYANNTLALFSDPSNSIASGMSDSVRISQVNSMIDGGGVTTLFARSGGYYHIAPSYMLAFTNEFVIAGVGDSRNQKGGSSNSITWDQSYTWGFTGKLLGLKYAVLDLSAANERFSNWVINPTNNVVRRSALQYVNGWHNATGVNDINDYVGDIPQLTTNYNLFMNLSEFSGKVAFGMDIPPFAPFIGGSSNPPSNYGITETSNPAGSQASREAYNNLVNSDARYLKVYQVNQLFSSRTNYLKPKTPKGARSIEGSGATAGAFTVTAATWASTNGGQVTFTVSTDPTAAVQPNDYVTVTGVTASIGSFNSSYRVISVNSTTVVVLATSSSSIGTYTSGGTLTSRNYVIAATKGSFSAEDVGLSIASNNFRGSGVWGYSIINKVTSSSTAILLYVNNTAMVSIPATETFYLGGSQLYNFEGSNAGFYDPLHTSRFAYQYLYNIGEVGAIKPGIYFRLPELMN